MILTDKCKEEFELWLLKQRNEIIKDGDIEYDFYYLYKYILPNDLKYALIIEFFDSVGIYITTERNFFFDDWACKITGHYKEKYFRTRSEATQSAITKANEIFNNLNK
jgi:hypothetical protein